MIIIRFFATLRMTIRYKMTASADIPWFRNEQDKAERAFVPKAESLT